MKATPVTICNRLQEPKRLQTAAGIPESDYADEHLVISTRGTYLMLNEVKRQYQQSLQRSNNKHRIELS